MPTRGKFTTSCAEISVLYQQWSEMGGQGSLTGIPGQLAYDCLRSMPFREELAVRFLDELAKYVEFQSTIEVLKSPPEGYISPSLDIPRGFDKIRQRVRAGLYKSQADFDYDIKSLVGRANDGHFHVNLCSQRVFHFQRGLPLVSISEDGLQLPQIYTFSDAALKSSGFGNVSHLAEIDGVDAVYSLEANLGIALGYQDPDTRYNQLFHSPASNFSDAYSGGAWTSHEGLWPGAASYSLTFANGTRRTVETTATWASAHGPMSYQDGSALFGAACLPQSSSAASLPGSRVTHLGFDVPPSGVLAYPAAIAHDQRQFIQGHYLDRLGFEDVAVMQVSSFRLGGVAGDFVQTAVEFLEQAAADNKKRLILDLSSNDGGDVIPGFHLFQTLFPGQPIYSATRFRATELINLMGKAYSETYRNRTEKVPLDPPFIAHTAVDPSQNQTFSSWKSLFGPHKILGANMSSLYAHFPFSAALPPPNPGPPKPLFAAENILIITNGHCASTCALLATLLTSQNTRTIAFGGRPRPGPMQALGAVRGGQYWSFSTIAAHISRAREFAREADRAGRPIWGEAERGRFEGLAPVGLGGLALGLHPGAEGGVNFRSGYLYGGEVPLQFFYQAAGCRLFFTAENVVRPETVWGDAAAAVWGGRGCVAGTQ
ncbi:peptidase S41 family protein [Lasiosphaeria hispida]|uniref:Peptidase S41 family protein n=1 Tax=Lasiosphaeria hispida TaxID=260671 RepID=A0AAJ0HEJ7_9PEZI|nr:peptidase S41 family protein [Lasiosphaeria hispida]